MLKKLRIALLLFVATCFLASSASAQSSGEGGTDEIPEGEEPSLVDITVRPFGQRMLTPIAVPNAIGDGSTPTGALSEMGELIRRCLQISGYFEVLGPDRFFFDPDGEGMEPENIRYRVWTRIGSEAVVKTAWNRVDGGIDLNFRLFDVASESPIDIGWERKTVPPDQVRSEIYAFINAIILYYSGDEGIFGERIAFSAPGGGGSKQIYTISIDGTQLSGITGGSGMHLFPSWSNGAILYTQLKNDRTTIESTGSDRPISARDGLNMNAAVSPDGSTIAATLSPDGNTDIFLLDATGDILQRCTTHYGEDLSPTWSPDGSQIAFVSDRSGGPQIFVMNSDCSNQRRVTFRGSYNTGPEWSPRGDVIAFTGRAAGRFDIFTVNPATNYIERLTQDQGSNMEPTWSPDGRYIAFVSTRGGRGASLYVSTADGQIQTLVSDGLSGVDTPAWQR